MFSIVHSAYDSGSPIIIPGDSVEDDLLVALVSWGEECADAQFPGMFVVHRAFIRGERQNVTTSLTVINLFTGSRFSQVLTLASVMPMIGSVRVFVPCHIIHPTKCVMLMMIASSKQQLISS